MRRTNLKSQAIEIWKRKQIFRVLTYLTTTGLAIAVALISLESAKGFIVQCLAGVYTATEGQIANLLILGTWIAAGITVSSLATAIILFVMYISKEAISLYLSIEKLLEPSPCKFSDLIHIDRLAREEFGDAASNFSQIQSLWKMDMNCFWLVRQQGAVVGYFSVLRLSELGKTAIENGTFTGSFPAQGHLCDASATTQDLYIGAAFGKKKFARAAVLCGLITYVKTQKPKNTYARAWSSDGESRLEDYGFRLLENELAKSKKFYIHDENSR